MFLVEYSAFVKKKLEIIYDRDRSSNTGVETWLEFYSRPILLIMFLFYKLIFLLSFTTDFVVISEGESHFFPANPKPHSLKSR